MLPLASIPEQFHPCLESHFNSWLRRASASDQELLLEWLSQSSDRTEQLLRTWLGSDYVIQAALNQPQSFVTWLQQGLMEVSLSAQTMAELLNTRLNGVEDEAAFDRKLRLFRRDMMMRIIWRDFSRRAPLMETTGDMTSLAEVVIQAAIAFHYRALEPRWGKPIGKHSGGAQPLVVLGMGKLGGWELNVSSDIDLIFTYPESGDTVGGRKSVTNQEFFIRLGQKVINSIDNNTVDGFVFRVDMRLRPYGQSGALVLNFDSMEEYYQTQGRDWERYAMIKARVVSGDVLPGAAAAGEELMRMLQPFTYRRYLDFSAIESMRSMKGMINREVQRKGISGDVKLGAGGIREVEFVVQVFQMIRGGRDDRLRERRVLKLLPLLESEGFLPQGSALSLAEAYTFLRNTEHAIQGYQDKQTQSLPMEPDAQQRLAWVLGFDHWDDFFSELERHRREVNQQFQAVISESESDDKPQGEYAAWQSLWPRDAGPEVIEKSELTEMIAAKGYAEPERIAQAMIRFQGIRVVKSMQAEGRTRLDLLMPMLLAVIQERNAAVETFERILVLMEAVARRTAYILLLVENPNALHQLVRLFGASTWIADQLIRYPALLDELLDPDTLYNPPDKDQLRDELRQQTLRLEWDDLEAQMETLRYFRMSHALRVAASEVTDALPLMRVSDYLTWLAEVLLEHVQHLAWQQMIERHGYPAGSWVDGAAPLSPRFIILGYGKLGGIELGHGSDLDLVFIYDASTKGYSDGEKPLDNQTFYTRLGQKIIHILNTQTVSGQLYEVDMRLRPSGSSGMLVSSLTGFEKYQRNEAWIWEHQALVRARVVCGDKDLQQKFEALREQLLIPVRDEQELRAEVVKMREKMREHLGSKGSEAEKASQFHLKQDAGGIVDIEFIVQYAVLAWAHKVPELTRFSDNIRVLEVLAQSALIDEQEAAQLIDAYKHFRSVGHRLVLQNLPGVVGAQELAEQREAVKAVWMKLLG